MSGLLAPLALIAVFVLVIAVFRFLHLRQERGEWPGRPGVSPGRKEPDGNDG